MQYLRKSCLTLLLLAASLMAQAQQNETPVGMVEQPCSPPPVMSPAVRTLLSDLFMVPHPLAQQDFARLMSDAAFADYNGTLLRNAKNDWPQLCRFNAANAAVLASGKHPHLVFIGDSITENWLLGDPALFNDATVNRGIGAQTTPHLLLRFRADVIQLQPDLVHILIGTNDVAGNTGPNSPQDYQNNLMSMVELARANGIGVLLGSIPPAASFNWQPSLKPVPRIRELNAWLQSYAKSEQLTYIDYYTALTDADGGLRAELTNDGVHPNYAGYAVMRQVLEAELAKLK